MWQKYTKLATFELHTAFHKIYNILWPTTLHNFTKFMMFFKFQLLKGKGSLRFLQTTASVAGEYNTDVSNLDLTSPTMHSRYQWGSADQLDALGLPACLTSHTRNSAARGIF